MVIARWTDSSTSTLLKWEFPISRKEHTCMECGGIIPPHDQYMREIHTDNGVTYSVTYHKRCKLPDRCCKDQCNEKVIVYIYTNAFCAAHGVEYLRLVKGIHYDLSSVA